MRSHSERDSKSVELVVRERDMLVCVCVCALLGSRVCGGYLASVKGEASKGTQPSLTNPPTRSLARERACDREADANEQQQQQQQRGEQAKTHLGCRSTNTRPSEHIGDIHAPTTWRARSPRALQRSRCVDRAVRTAGSTDQYVRALPGDSSLGPRTHSRGLMRRLVVVSSPQFFISACLG